MTSQTANPRYVLVTAAYNEEAYIEKTLQSVVAQTLLPQRWVIVSDGSTDRTDEIVERYASRFPFIRLARITEKHARNFAAQVNAINFGCAQLKDVNYQFIANLDSDISFAPDYYAQLLSKFDENPRLGLAGGFICEEQSRKFVPRRLNSRQAVAHAVQMFRRECFESTEGYKPLPYGGPDWHIEVVVRMKGWEVESFTDLEVAHHRPTGTADRIHRHCFRQGLMDFSMGSHPLFEMFKISRRLSSKPIVTGALARLTGFCWAYCRGEKKSVSPEFVKYLRAEQMHRVRGMFSRNPQAVE